MKVVLTMLVLATAVLCRGGERYDFVRSYVVDGQPVTLAADETDLDLAKLLPEAYAKGGPDARWATVEAVLESEEEKVTALYYRNEWYGDLFVNDVCARKGLCGPGEGFASVEAPLRKGMNRIRLRTKAGSRGWHCAMALDRAKRPEEADCVVDFTKTEGKIRPRLHASGFGPTICSSSQKSIDLIRSMNLSAARTHDWALINPNERVCDYFHVFPSMHLDATKAENYHFGPTDYLLKRTREETGLDVFFRLGTSIEHSGPKVHFNTLIPEDFDKVAEIFAGTVRHYNRGWANGYAWGIRDWEIWNEPDGRNNMWCLPEGDEDADPAVQDEKTRLRREKFVKFFITCLKRLKSEFPDIRVGGPALCSMDESYFTELLTACRAAGVAPDFISWHYYGYNVETILDSVARARRMCDRLGFTDCKLVLNEWHYMGFGGFGELLSTDPDVQHRVWEGPSSQNGTDSAAFTLSVLARFQASALDQAYYYGCRHTGSWGFMDERKNPYKVYYALKAFGEIVKGFPVLGEVKTTDSITTLVAKSADGARTALLLVDYRGRSGDVVADVRGLPSGHPSVRILDHGRNLEPVAARIAGDQLVLPKVGGSSASYLIIWE